MIDPHVHLRDWEQSCKETVKHGLSVAFRAGLDGIFEMPNTSPPLLSEKKIIERIALADSSGIPIFHGLYGGITSREEQLIDMIRCYNRHFPRVVGMKLYAGKSTGDLSVISEDAQRKIFSIMKKEGYRGVVAVHCEKEALFRPELWNPEEPGTHGMVRPSSSESASVKDILSFAGDAGFEGTLLICHISTPASVYEIERQKAGAPFKIVCGVTPHHLVLNESDFNKSGGDYLKMNPPLRSREEQEEMWSLLLSHRIDWIETDHAPHTLGDKPWASGIPGLPFYPHIIHRLCGQNVDNSLLQDITHDNICRTFGIEINASGREGDMNLAREYPFDAFIHCR